MLNLSTTERERAIGDILAGLFYTEMVTPPSVRTIGSREEIHRLVFGMIANRMTRYEDALALPERLCGRLGYHDILECLLDHTVEQIAETIAAPKALHRYPMRIATSLCASARQIERDWKCDIRSMWAEDECLGRDLVVRLMTLHGVGEKISNLIARSLILNFAGVKCWDGIASLRPSPDRHVLRVFNRLGLIDGEDDIQGLFAAAERCRPFESVACDGAWIIGLSWKCGTSDATCHDGNEEGEPCRLLRFCPSAR
jgi:endonuclease III